MRVPFGRHVTYKRCMLSQKGITGLLIEIIQSNNRCIQQPPTMIPIWHPTTKSCCIIISMAGSFVRFQLIFFSENSAISFGWVCSWHHHSLPLLVQIILFIHLINFKHGRPHRNHFQLFYHNFTNRSDFIMYTLVYIIDVKWIDSNIWNSPINFSIMIITLYREKYFIAIIVCIII